MATPDLLRAACGIVFAAAFVAATLIAFNELLGGRR